MSATDFGQQVTSAGHAQRLDLAAELKAIITDPARRGPADAQRCAELQTALALPPDFVAGLARLVEERDAARRRLGTPEQCDARRAAILSREPEAMAQLEKIYLSLRYNSNSSVFLDQILKIAAAGGRCDIGAEAGAIGSPVDDAISFDKSLRLAHQEVFAAEDRLQTGLRAILPNPAEPQPESSRIIERHYNVPEMNSPAPETEPEPSLVAGSR